jgi:hypothetical protein
MIYPRPPAGEDGLTYYIGARGDPEDHQYIPEIAVPRDLHDGLEASLVLTRALQSGELTGRKRADIAVWIGAQSNKGRAQWTVNAALRFLGGEPVTEAEPIFERRYIEHIGRREALAALHLLVAQGTRGDVFIIDNEGGIAAKALTKTLLTTSLFELSQTSSHSKESKKR